VVAKITDRLSVSKRTQQKFRTDRFNITKLNDVEVNEYYWFKISNRLAALEKLVDYDVDINKI